jgi:hypothetical protein
MDVREPKDQGIAPAAEVTQALEILKALPLTVTEHFLAQITNYGIPDRVLPVFSHSLAPLLLLIPVR